MMRLYQLMPATFWLGLCACAATTTTSNMTTCQHSQQCIQQGTFLDWKGLPASCDWTDWTGPVPADWAEVPRSPLGSEHRNGHFMMLPLKNYYRPKLFFVDGHAVLFEGMNPELSGSVAELLEGYGEPAARLDWDFGTLPVAAGEWVYPERGVTLFLSGDHTRLFHIGLYAPTTLDHYQKALRPSLGKKRR